MWREDVAGSKMEEIFLANATRLEQQWTSLLAIYHLISHAEGTQNLISTTECKTLVPFDRKRLKILNTTHVTDVHFEFEIEFPRRFLHMDGDDEA